MLLSCEVVNAFSERLSQLEARNNAGPKCTVRHGASQANAPLGLARRTKMKKAEILLDHFPRHLDTDLGRRRVSPAWGVAGARSPFTV